MVVGMEEDVDLGQAEFLERVPEDSRSALRCVAVAPVVGIEAPTDLESVGCPGERAGALQADPADRSPVGLRQYSPVAKGMTFPGIDVELQEPMRLLAGEPPVHLKRHRGRLREDLQVVIQVIGSPRTQLKALCLQGDHPGSIPLRTAGRVELTRAAWLTVGPAAGEPSCGTHAVADRRERTRAQVDSGVLERWLTEHAADQQPAATVRPHSRPAVLSPNAPARTGVATQSRARSFLERSFESAE